MRALSRLGRKKKGLESVLDKCATGARHASIEHMRRTAARIKVIILQNRRLLKFILGSNERVFPSLELLRFVLCSAL